MHDISQFVAALPENATARQMREALDRGCEVVQPDPALRGPVFEVGEIIEIRGGKFKVHAIGRNGITLHGVPS